MRLPALDDMVWQALAACSARRWAKPCRVMALPRASRKRCSWPPGVHDTLMAACDDYRYGLLGCTEIPDKRTDNLAAALNELRLVPPETPSPLNLFANIPWEQDGGLTFAAPVRKPGDHALFEGDMDVVVASPPAAGDLADQRRGARADGSSVRDPRLTRAGRSPALSPRRTHASCGNRIRRAPPTPASASRGGAVSSPLVA